MQTLRSSWLLRPALLQITCRPAVSSRSCVLHAARCTVSTRSLKYAHYDGTTFTSVAAPLEIPDDLNVASFMLDYIPKDRFKPQGRTWLIDGQSGQSMTYEDCKERVDALASALQQDYGCQEHDAVAIISPNTRDYGIACWAAFRIGAIVTTVNPGFTSGEIEYQLRAVSKAHTLKAIFVHPDCSQAVQTACSSSDTNPSLIVSISDTVYPTGNSLKSVDDLVAAQSTLKSYSPVTFAPGEAKSRTAFISYSSGTTGHAKGVVISHYNVISNILQFAQAYKNRDQSGSSKSLATLPLYHIYGLTVMLHFNLYASIPLVLLPKFELGRFLSAIEEQSITHLWLVPPVALLLSKHPSTAKYDLSSVRTITIGAAPMGAAAVQALSKVFPNAHVGQGYGLTETSPVISVFPANDTNFPTGSVGALLSGIEAKIVSPASGKTLGPAENGEICVRGSNTALEYLLDPTASSAVFGSDGFVRTGDEGYFNEDGALFITDRIRELIKVKGVLVAPAELEGLLNKHPSVEESCVVGVKHSIAGELPRAFVVLRPNSTPHDGPSQMKDMLKRFVADQTASHKWLAGGIEFVDAIPKNASGKLLRRILRDQANRK